MATRLPTGDGHSNPLIAQGIRAAVDASQFEAQDEANRERLQAEEKVVTKLWTAYTEAREFDKDARGLYGIDRRYAAGTADRTWAVDTNLIGTFIDILVSFLYARNPDVSVRKTRQVRPSKTKDLDDLALTMELVVSSLWRGANLKVAARKMVRSGLSVGIGWLKATLICEAVEIPQVMADLNDSRQNMSMLEAQKADLANQVDAEGNPVSTDELASQMAALEETISSLNERIEQSVAKFLAVDFVAAEDMQVSPDVPVVSEHKDANWNANRIFRLKSELKELFPALTDADVQSAESYYQRALPKNGAQAPLTDQAYGVGGSADDAEMYIGAKTAASGSAGPAFAMVVELWDKKVNMVKTMIPGVKKWAKAPYKPAYPTKRFYPYYQLAFYEVDGARHPQSLSWRLSKLQNEYSRCRSSQRITRERSIPGVLVNGNAIPKEEMEKINNSVINEYTVINPTNPDADMNKCFAPKPVSSVDIRLYDTSPILTDMEKIAGVQEALQSSVTVQKTAKEAGIQEQGFASRTDADRDQLETLLTDLAQATAEQALGALKLFDVQRICGPGAFWPENMDIDELFNLVDIDIEAGTTGKPKEAGDREAWGVVLPVITDTIAKIRECLAQGDYATAKVYAEVIRETMIRMGDDTDIDRFLPPMPDIEIDPLTGLPMPPPLPGGPPGMPGDPSLVPPAGADPNSPPAPSGAGGGAPALPI